MIEVLITMILAMIILSGSMTSLFVLMRESTQIEQHAIHFQQLVQAELLITRLIKGSGFSICLFGDVNNHLPIKILAKPLPRLVRPGRGRYRHGSLLEVNSTDRSSLIIEQLSAFKFVLKNRLSLKAGRQVLVSNCLSSRVQTVARYANRQQRGVMILNTTLDSHFGVMSRIARLRHRVLYLCQAGLCLLAMNHRRYVMVAGIDLFHIKQIKPNRFLIQLGVASNRIQYTESI